MHDSLKFLLPTPNNKLSFNIKNDDIECDPYWDVKYVSTKFKFLSCEKEIVDKYLLLKFPKDKTINITTPNEKINEVLEYLDCNLVEFNENIDKHRNKEIWNLVGNKYIKSFEIK